MVWLAQNSGEEKNEVRETDKKRIYYDYEKWHIRHSVCKTSFWLFLTLCIATLIKKWNKQVQSYAVYNKEWKKTNKNKKSLY